MTPQQYQRASDLFDAALQRDTAERDHFLTHECADDPDVDRAVRAMLAQHTDPSFDLDSSPLTGKLNLAAMGDPHALGDETPVARIPTKIGPYTILGILGAGGMSIVYRAQQEFPQRIVAVKVLRRGLLSQRTLRRFRAEVQTLAKLSHPNIAQIYQAGSYHDGDDERPYFAMELVEGLPLTEYATQHRLNVRQKLELMIAVCRAVQHAHLRGVIHRDLKPGNILVGQRDEGAEVSRCQGVQPTLPRYLDTLTPCPLPHLPKILDFGIARATDVDIARATLTAETGQIVGTLPYMSPEQLTGEGADEAALDLRSDVYALGVTLFELLTGVLPHKVTESAPLTEAIRHLTHDEPRTLGEVDRSLRGELEVIVATALEHDRERRYQSAEALADDLQAHLEHRPIRARPPGPILRARKWLRRHPTTATAASLLLLAMLSIIGVIIVQQREARQGVARELHRLLGEARSSVQAYAGDLDASRRRQSELDDVHNWLYRYNPAERALELEQREQELLRVQAEHESTFHRIIDVLSRAERLGAAEDDVRRLHARLYLARAREAEAAGDRFARSMCLELVRRNDPSNELAGELVDRFPITIRSDPPGAEVHLFRLVEQSEIVRDGEPRLAPVAVGLEAWGLRPEGGGSQASSPESQAGVVPGQFAFRVIDGRGVLDELDLVLGIRGNPVRDSVLVIDGPPSLTPLARLTAIDETIVRGRYDVETHGKVSRDESGSTRQKRFAFANAGALEQIILTGESLEAIGVRVAEASAALEHAGGEVDVWRGGRTERMSLPPGLRFRITSKPLLVSEQSRFGVTPIESVEVERGQYIALLVKDGFEPLRVPIEVREPSANQTSQPMAWKIQPRGSTPEGFVAIARSLVPEAEPFWMMEREVTIAEYLEFLNDPETRAKIDASATPILYPRAAGMMECGRDASGTFTLGVEFQPDWPALCISWNDAKAYAEWKTRKWNDREGDEETERRRDGVGCAPSPDDPTSSLRLPVSSSLRGTVIFDLPTHREWLCAWGCSGDNQFPWGMHFRPWWCSSNYTHAMPNPEPVLSFPIDESNLGVFDLAGSVSEWLNAWWIEERGQREFGGGSWGHGGYNYHNMFMLYGHNGMLPTGTSGTLGFRLVMRVEK